MVQKFLCSPMDGVVSPPNLNVIFIQVNIMTSRPVRDIFEMMSLVSNDESHRHAYVDGDNTLDKVLMKNGW